jgi:hypothetical protein
VVAAMAGFDKGSPDGSLVGSASSLTLLTNSAKGKFDISQQQILQFFEIIYVL